MSTTVKKNIFDRAVKKAVLAAVVCLIWGTCALAGETPLAPLIMVTGRGGAFSDAAALSVPDFIPWERSLKAEDPNFPEDGIKIFTGVNLTRVLELAGLDNRYGLTVIGSDQYVGYLTPAQVSSGMLVWKKDGQPIPGLRGGPLKLMFPKESSVHAACYTWYVTALIQGRPKAPALTVTASDKAMTYTVSSLAALAEPLPPSQMSIAQGCSRSAVPEMDQPVRAVSLTRLTGNLSQADTVELIPFYGPAVRLKPEALAFDARIILDMHPALGGPYAVVFPIEAHHELKGLIPESGAFFFLKTIVVR